jgi:hypothetical protein
LVAAATATLQDRNLQAYAKEMTRTVTAVRGLKFKTDVKVGAYNRDQLSKFLLAELDKEVTPAEFSANEKILKKMGVFPSGSSLKQTITELLTGSIGGFYHPRTKEMRLIQGDADPQKDQMNKLFKAQFGVTMDDMTLAHELCHAAQDQNFELLSLPIQEKKNDDLVQAIKAIIEGDANLLGWKYGTKDRLDQMLPNVIGQYKSAKTGNPKADAAPGFLRKSLTFPYGHGTEFVAGIWKAAGQNWEAVTKLFSDPPSSTEQILHPEKYSQRDYPQILTCPGIEKSLAGFKFLAENVLGEFGIALLFEELGSANAAAAAGWDGDRFWGFEAAGKVMIVWFSTWDSEADAREFADAWTDLLSRKYPGSTRDGEVLSSSDKEKCLVRVKGSDVLSIEGGTPDALAKADSLFAGLKKTELKKVERVKPKR